MIGCNRLSSVAVLRADSELELTPEVLKQFKAPAPDKIRVKKAEEEYRGAYRSAHAKPGGQGIQRVPFSLVMWREANRRQG